MGASTEGKRFVMARIGKLFDILYKTKDIIKEKDGKMELFVEISPRFGKISHWIYFLCTGIELIFEKDV